MWRERCVPPPLDWKPRMSRHWRSRDRQNLCRQVSCCASSDLTRGKEVTVIPRGCTCSNSVCLLTITLKLSLSQFLSFASLSSSHHRAFDFAFLRSLTLGDPLQWISPSPGKPDKKACLFYVSMSGIPTLSVLPSKLISSKGHGQQVQRQGNRQQYSQTLPYA